MKTPIFDLVSTPVCLRLMKLQDQLRQQRYWLRVQQAAALKRLNGKGAHVPPEVQS